MMAAMFEAPELVRASRRDIPRLAELWVHAFPGERTLEQRVRQLEAGGVYGGIEDAWYFSRHERLAAAVRLYSMTQYLHGTPLRMLGVAAVAVASDARRQGLGGELCRQALRLGRERGELVSVLYPFRPDFYHRLGWGLVGSLHTFRFHPHSLPRAASPTRVRLCEPALRPGVAVCYARVAAESHGLLRRNGRIWEQHLANGERYLFVLPGSSGGVAGYLLATYRLSPRPAARELVVRELVAVDDAAYRELLGWISLQADQWPVVRYDALPEEHFDTLLEEPRPPRFRAARTLWMPVAQRIRGPMLRVLDVPGALLARAAWPQATPFAFTLGVLDPELPENAGPWRVEYRDGRVACAPAGAGSADIDLEIPAAEFAQLYAGELSARAAIALGRARRGGEERTIEAVDALFHTPRTLRLLDEF